MFLLARHVAINQLSTNKAKIIDKSTRKELEQKQQKKYPVDVECLLVVIGCAEIKQAYNISTIWNVFDSETHEALAIHNFYSA
jgi:hypothetical protein